MSENNIPPVEIVVEICALSGPKWWAFVFRTAFNNSHSVRQKKESDQFVLCGWFAKSFWINEDVKTHKILKMPKL